MTAAKTRGRAGRPIKPPTPGQRGKVNTVITPTLKERLMASAAPVGNTLGQEIEARVEWSFDYEKRLGGPRTLHLLQMLAEIAQIAFENEDDWHNHRVNWDTVLRLWTEALDARAPLPATSLKEQIAAGRAVVDIVRTGREPERHDHYCAILLSMATDARFPDHVRAEFAGAAVLERPERSEQPPLAPSEPASLVEEVIQAGGNLVARLAAETDLQRRDYHKDLLRRVARLEGLPQEVRDEFEAAAESTVVQFPPAGSPTEPVPDKTRPPHVVRFDAAWDLAREVARQNSGQAEPSLAEIAEVFAADEELSLFDRAGMPQGTRDPAAVLRYRTQIEEERARALAEPGGETTATRPPPARRRRTAPASGRKV